MDGRGMGPLRRAGIILSRRRRLCLLSLNSGNPAAVGAGLEARVFSPGSVATLSSPNVAVLGTSAHRKAKARLKIS